MAKNRNFAKLCWYGSLRMIGVDDEGINHHVGWCKKGMVDHYANVGKLIGPKGPASLLSKAADKLSIGESALDKISRQFSGVNKMKKFKF